MIELLSGEINRDRWEHDLQVCIGISGVSYATDRTIFLPEFLETLPFRPARWICTGDAEIMYLSLACPYFENISGSMLISGAGSLAYTLEERGGELNHHRIGGHGPSIGDDGSGYWMGREVLRSIGYEYQTTKGIESILTQKVIEWLQRTDVNYPEISYANSIWRELCNVIRDRSSQGRIDLRPILFSLSGTIERRTDNHLSHVFQGMDVWRKVVSNLTIPLFSAYEANDEAAIRIVENAAALLAEQHSRTIGVFSDQPSTNMPILLAGGVFAHNPAFCDVVLTKIAQKEEAERQAIRQSEECVLRPALGALLFSLANSKTGALRKPKRSQVEKICENVKRPPFADKLRND
ncbi:BadF/BadG/BcrA/BcrD ATPase family protein [Cerasicoccus frondis]|uniref:BadF/BadG/BcrA/BcrD ATPase family protein n=1 Tax=Cerasicoccus frondis TaxID=490090 RepID=UPI0028526649|nr:BadF/BadG/BcrA/BcrD ATPase family protein [Cerasicoccus frondis]